MLYLFQTFFYPPHHVRVSPPTQGLTGERVRMLPQFFLFVTIAGGTSPGPDIFTRQRIHDCGASMMRRAGAEMDWGAKFDEWPAIAREIDVDAATASRDAGNGSVYYAVALMVDQQSRVEHTRELLARHPQWHVFNSTSKYSVDVLYRHYVGMGLRLREFKLEPLLGKVAWRGTARETRKRHRNNRSSPVDLGFTVAPPVVFPEHPPSAAGGGLAYDSACSSWGPATHTA